MSKRLIQIGVAVLCVLAFSGCGRLEVPMGSGPVSLGMEGDEFLVGVCAGKIVTRIVGEYRTLDGSKEWVVFLEAQGERSLSRWDVIDIDYIREYFDVSVYEPPPLEDVSLTIRLEDGKSALVGSFLIEGQAISSGTWLHNDGSKTLDVCVPYDFETPTN